MSKIILLGYMGVGKSTLGKLISQRLDKDFCDLDTAIEEAFQLPVHTVFKTKGELAFRKEEKNQLHKLLDQDIDLIFSLGGGTPFYYDNADFIFDQNEFQTIYLTSALQNLTKRLLLEKDVRPLISHLQSEAELEDFIRKHLFERHHVYDRAMHKVSVDEKSPDAIADEIISLLS
ncbi:MAG: AAA family ATPase [Psychroflexus sp.]|nr:AAA family ATPase [Psychroflexus sp.]MDN6310409.1 AAA family ATPase [Psychroflexus sp.]